MFCCDSKLNTVILLTVRNDMGNYQNLYGGSNNNLPWFSQPAWEQLS